MERIIVSDKAVEKALEESTFISREKWRRLRCFSREAFSRYILEIYKSGFQDGCDAVVDRINEERDPDVEEVQIDWEDILKLISEVKGVGPELVNAIDQKLREVY